MSSRNHVRHANRQSPNVSWTDEQRELLILRWRTMPDRELAVLVSKHGPTRSVDAVAEKRLEMGLKRSKGPARGTSNPSASAAWQAYRDNQSGWSVVTGTVEEQSKRHMQALYDALKAERAGSLGGRSA